MLEYQLSPVEQELVQKLLDGLPKDRPNLLIHLTHVLNAHKKGGNTESDKIIRAMKPDLLLGNLCDSFAGITTQVNKFCKTNPSRAPALYGEIIHRLERLAVVD